MSTNCIRTGRVTNTRISSTPSVSPKSRKSKLTRSGKSRLTRPHVLNQNGQSPKTSFLLHIHLSLLSHLSHHEYHRYAFRHQLVSLKSHLKSPQAIQAMVSQSHGASWKPVASAPIGILSSSEPE